MIHFFGILPEKPYLRSANQHRMQQKSTLSTRFGWLMTLLGAVAAFVFFQCFYPYHLMHREQTMLFLNNADFIAQQYPLLQRGFLARLTGDFLQQFFYYLVAGPAIVATLLTLIGVLVFQIVRKFSDKIGCLYLAYAVAIGCYLWEGSRECLPEYPLAATIQVLGWLLLIRLALIAKTGAGKLGLITGCILLGGILFDIGHLPNTKPYGKPDMTLEHQMALDVEASYGHWNKVEDLTQENLPYNTEIYYRNLSLAMRNALTENLFDHYQNADEGLFLPVNENGNYFLFSAAGEAWWAVGDLTMAEHATMLGMIFSPRHTGTRNLRRLAEINLAKGDRPTAMKYLRLLQQTIPHRQWAEAHMQQIQAQNYQTEIQSTIDTLRLSSQTQRSLRNLLDSHPNNIRAMQYLMAYDLLTKDMISFAEDFESYGMHSVDRTLEEAMLIVMASRPEMRDRWHDYIQESTYRDFQSFNRIFEQSKGNPQALKAEFGNTYWYYMQFAKKGN